MQSLLNVLNKTIANLVLWILFLLITSACLPSAEFSCQDPLGCLEIPPAAPIRIAYLLTQTEGYKVQAIDSQRGIITAIKERQGTISGHPIELVEEKVDCSQESILKTATKLSLQSTILGVIGSPCPEAINHLATNISDAGQIFVSLYPANWSASLVRRSIPPGYFQFTPDVQMIAKRAADFAFYDLQTRKAAIIFQEFPTSLELSQGFATRFNQLGGKIIYQQQLQPGITELKSALTAVAESPPDLLFFPLLDRQAARLITSSREISGLQETFLLSTDSAFTDTLITEIGEAGIDVFIVSSDFSYLNQLGLKPEWIAGSSEPIHNWQYMYSYYAARLLFSAIETSMQQGTKGSLIINRASLRSAMIQTNNFYEPVGIFIARDSNSIVGRMPIVVYRITHADVQKNQWPPESIWIPSQD